MDDSKQTVSRYRENARVERVAVKPPHRKFAPRYHTTFYLQILTGKRDDERTRTADLISLRVIDHALRGLAEGCNTRILRPVSFSGLPRVAPYRVPGGVRVVSEVRGMRVAGSFALYLRIGIRRAYRQPVELTLHHAG